MHNQPSMLVRASPRNWRFIHSPISQPTNNPMKPTETKPFWQVRFADGHVFYVAEDELEQV